MADDLTPDSCSPLSGPHGCASSIAPLDGRHFERLSVDGIEIRAVGEWLAAQRESRLTLTRAQVESLVGSLPPSSNNRIWWGNSGRGQSAVWMAVGWKVAAVDAQTGDVTFERGEVATRGPNGGGAGRRAILDGTLCLEAMVQRAGWASITQAVAAHTVFLQADTVRQAEGRAMFPVVRDMNRRGVLGELPDGRPVLFDDNMTPTDAFLWAANRTKGPDVQFNHVWNASLDPDSYTALWNLCCSPAFLAKPSDTHAPTIAALRFRAWELFGHRPAGEPEPIRPDGYEQLTWAPSPEPVDLEATFRTRMGSAKSRRATLAAARIGWCFSNGPDPTIVAAGVA